MGAKQAVRELNTHLRSQNPMYYHCTNRPEALAGFEPANTGFVDRSLNRWGTKPKRRQRDAACPVDMRLAPTGVERRANPHAFSGCLFSGQMLHQPRDNGIKNGNCYLESVTIPRIKRANLLRLSTISSAQSVHAK